MTNGGFYLTVKCNLLLKFDWNCLLVFWSLLIITSVRQRESKND